MTVAGILIAYVRHYKTSYQGNCTKMTLKQERTYGKYTVWRKILTVENFDESGLGKF